jgi:hypothetical protein
MRNIACSACGFANEAGEKFCGGCGASLAAAPAGARDAGMTSRAKRVSCWIIRSRGVPMIHASMT